MAEWRNAKTDPPTEDARYLCVFDYDYGIGHHYSVHICCYTQNLEGVDELIFAGEKRPGWFEYGDDGWVHHENLDVICWMPLPELPDELKEG